MQEKKNQWKVLGEPPIGELYYLNIRDIYENHKKGGETREIKREMDGEYLMKDSPLRGLSSELG